MKSWQVIIGDEELQVKTNTKTYIITPCEVLTICQQNDINGADFQGLFEQIKDIVENRRIVKVKGFGMDTDGRINVIYDGGVEFQMIFSGEITKIEFANKKGMKFAAIWTNRAMTTSSLDIGHIRKPEMFNLHSNDNYDCFVDFVLPLSYAVGQRLVKEGKNFKKWTGFAIDRANKKIKLVENGLKPALKLEELIECMTEDYTNINFQQRTRCLHLLFYNNQNEIIIRTTFYTMSNGEWWEFEIRSRWLGGIKIYLTPGVMKIGRKKYITIPLDENDMKVISELTQRFKKHAVAMII